MRFTTPYYNNPKVSFDVAQNAPHRLAASMWDGIPASRMIAVIFVVARGATAGAVYSWDN
jgi:hypothetical protein